MTTRTSFTTCIRRFKAGDREAVGQLWRRLERPLANVARRDLRHAGRRVADEEDVAQSAFYSFWRGAVAGRFPRLCDNASLWQLLRVIVRRKALDQQQLQRRQKRGGGFVRGESALQATPSRPGLDGVAQPAISPSMLVETRETRQRMLDELDDEQLRQIALLKMHGHTNEEIASELALSRATIARKLDRIRKVWLASAP